VPKLDPLLQIFVHKFQMKRVSQVSQKVGLKSTRFAGLVLRILRGKATFALVKGNKEDSPEGTKAKLQIEGRASTSIAVGAVNCRGCMRASTSIVVGA
jgi:hypothetical protein